MQNCYEISELTNEICDSFAKDKNLIIELGAGNGFFSIELATQYPDTRFIAVDVKADRLYSGARVALNQELNNIIFLRSHALQLVNILQPHSVHQIWLTFSDPYPKEKQAKHRLTHTTYLQIYRKLLTKHGNFHFKTDNHNLFCWSLEQCVLNNMVFSSLSFDLHRSKVSDDCKIMTTYEKRYVISGLPIHYLQATFND